MRRTDRGIECDKTLGWRSLAAIGAVMNRQAKAKRSSFMTARLFLVGSLCAACLLGQGTFVYTNNDVIPNTVSAFSVGADGALSGVPPFSPFATGGTGVGGGNKLIGADSITTAIVKDFLYVANGGSDDV